MARRPAETAERPRMKDVAQAPRLSAISVSIALRDHPYISKRRVTDSVVAAPTTEIG